MNRLPTTKLRLAALVCLVQLGGGGQPLDAQGLPSSMRLVTVRDSREVDIGVAVLREAYGRLGMTIEVERLAGDLALQRLRDGEADGDVHRIDGAATLIPGVMQIPVPINYFEISVYSMDAELKPRGWTDLRSLDVGIVRGQLAAERAVRGMSVREVDTFEDLFALLRSGEVDVVVAPRINGDILKLAGGMDDVVMNGVMDTYLLYHYVHESRAQVIPALQPILQGMLGDGTIQSIRARVLDELLRGPVGG